MGFQADALYERHSAKFGIHERVVRLRPVVKGQFITRQCLADALTEGLRDAVKDVLNNIGVPDQDRFYISLGSDRLRNAANAFHLTVGEWRRDDKRAKTLLERLANMLNSNENFELDDSFNLNVVHVEAPPRGSGRKRAEFPGNQSLERLRQINHEIIVDITPPVDGWCVPSSP